MLAGRAVAQFTYTTNNGAITITGYTGSGGAVTIPSIINGYPVVTIGVQDKWIAMLEQVNYCSNVEGHDPAAMWIHPVP